MKVGVWGCCGLWGGEDVGIGLEKHAVQTRQTDPAPAIL